MTATDKPAHGAAADDAQALYRYGMALRQQGDVRGALDAFRRAIAADPAPAEFHTGLGGLLFSQGDFAGAAAAYAQAAQRSPGAVAPLFNQGVALGQLGRPSQAEACMRQVLALRSDFVPAWVALAGALIALGRPVEAEEAAQRAVGLQPTGADAWLNLGRAWMDQGRLADAEQASRRALELAPGMAQAAYNLGCILQYQWRPAEALAAFRQATEIDPTHQPAWCNRLMLALYDTAETERSIAAASLDWARRTSGHEPAQRHDVPAAGDPGRRLRVGYVSPDFRHHSCAFFLKPLLAAHDPAAVEVFAYANVATADETTAWFRGHVHHWRDIRAMGDPAAAALVRADRIDILVDLAGHTQNGRPGLFRLKPAPVQVSWLGYPSTTGLQEIDHRLTDAIADPEGDADLYHVEKLVRIEGGCLCYAPRDDAPAVGPLPALERGYVTFGSFNNLIKVTPAVVAAWAGILHAVPGSRLLLKAWMLNFSETRVRIEAAFAEQGIGHDRLLLQAWMPRGQALDLYQQVDIALDTFPYNGTTTSFEALWMGVPVITLRGGRHAGRVGASILAHLGRSEWIAEDLPGYAAIARRLSGDLAALATTRAALRGELENSPLTDGTGFARRFERALRRIWLDRLRR